MAWSFISLSLVAAIAIAWWLWPADLPVQRQWVTEPAAIFGTVQGVYEYDDGRHAEVKLKSRRVLGITLTEKSISVVIEDGLEIEISNRVSIEVQKLIEFNSNTNRKRVLATKYTITSVTPDKTGWKDMLKEKLR